MNAFRSALWAEALKARRSRITLLTVIGFMLVPLAGGLFMIILKDPAQARAWGLISAKAQLTMGAADWPSFFGFLTVGMAAGGAILFALITAWVFGREFSDHTVKEWMALPTSREIIVSAKFVLIAIWCLSLALILFLATLGVGSAIGIPGWSPELAITTFWVILLSTLLNFLLMPFVAWIASSGRGYLPPIGWAILTLAFANIVSLLGYGDWFPWGVPVLVSGMVKTNAEQVGLHSYLMVILAFIIGLAVTFYWWRSADQAR